jgi:hypothetical protein
MPVIPCALLPIKTSQGSEREISMAKFFAINLHNSGWQKKSYLTKPLVNSGSHDVPIVDIETTGIALRQMVSQRSRCLYTTGKGKAF